MEFLDPDGAVRSINTDENLCDALLVDPCLDLDLRAVLKNFFVVAAWQPAVHPKPILCASTSHPVALPLRNKE
jgi:hypothetical protein